MFGQGKDTPSRGKDLIDHIKNKNTSTFAHFFFNLCNL